MSASVSESTNSWMLSRMEKIKSMIVCNIDKELATILSLQMMLDQLISISNQAKAKPEERELPNDINIEWNFFTRL